MRTPCWVCRRAARGFGQTDIRFRPGEAGRYRPEWVFCSRRCQDTFAAMYGRWVATGPEREEPFMVDPSDAERAALRACLKAFGEAAGVIGFDKALGAYSEAEALVVIEAIVTGYTDALAAAPAGATHLPPDRGEFKDDLPWEG